MIGTSKSWRRWVVMLMSMAMVLAACGDDTGTGDDETTTTAGDDGATCETMDDVRVQLQWVAQLQFAGYFVAKDLGFYEDECLNVEILEGAVGILTDRTCHRRGRIWIGLGPQGTGVA